MKVQWLNLLLVEACWAAMAYYFGGSWLGRLLAFLFLNTLLLWGWRTSRARR
jgi:hypothetical protein